MRAPTIETERLIIRALSISDKSEFVSELTSNSEIMKNLSEECGTPTGQETCAEHYIEDYSFLWRDHGYGGWAVCAGTNEFSDRGKLLGFCGFGMGQIDDAGPELSFAYGKLFWGKGIATEAARACLDWFFVRACHERCYVCHHSWNDASRKIINKLGFVYSRDEDLWGSVEKGDGLLPTYRLDRVNYSKGTPQP